MLLIVSIRDLKPEARNKAEPPTLADLQEGFQRSAIHCSTVILHDSGGQWGSDEVILKSREHGA